MVSLSNHEGLARAGGATLLPPPTDPDVPNYGILLFAPEIRSAEICHTPPLRHSGDGAHGTAVA